MMTLNPKSLKISIITICYNSDQTIETNLNSVAKQTYNNFEHIVIDGKSDDNSISIVRKFPHVKKIISEKDEGIYHAMNKGIEIAKGDIIGFLNSDDFYSNNNVLSKVAETFAKINLLDACYSDLIYTSRKKITKNIRYWKAGKFIAGSFSKGWCPPHPTFFVRRSVYESLGKFDLSFRLASDVDLMMRFLEIKKIKSYYIPEVLVKMRTGGITNKNLTNIRLQNMEILSSFNKNGLAVNPISFFLYKFISRTLQFFKSHPK